MNNHNSELDWQFLTEYLEFGVFSHGVTANALLDAYKNSDNPDVLKILRVRIFAEVIANIEDLAGICIAMRDRNSLPIITSYLNYGKLVTEGVRVEAPKDFFKTINSGGTLNNWLDVAISGSEIYKQINDQFSNKKSEAEKTLLKAAQIYLSRDQIFIRAYNKTKHGFVVTRGFSQENPYFPDKENSVSILYGLTEAHDDELIYKINEATLDLFDGLDEELRFLDKVTQTAVDIIKYVVELAKNGCLD